MHEYTPEIDDIAADRSSRGPDREPSSTRSRSGRRDRSRAQRRMWANHHASGIGGHEAFDCSPRSCTTPRCRSTTRGICRSCRAPTEAAVLFDLIVGACSIYGGSWIEGAGAVHAENEALQLAHRPGRMPDSRGWRVRAGRDDRQPVGAGRGSWPSLAARRQATTPIGGRSWRQPVALVGQVGG